MKVDMNNIGNYSMAYVKNNGARVNNAQINNQTAISSEEKNFFAGLYPAQKEEVLGYNFYTSKGKVTGMHVGSLFDRRG